MAYAVRADLADCGLPAEALATIPDASQDKQLDVASDIADSYLNKRYTLPLQTPYPKTLVGFVCDIAAWRLITTLGYSSQGRDDAFRARYKDAMQWLDDVGDRRLNPGGIIEASPTIDTPQVWSDPPEGW